MSVADCMLQMPTPYAYNASISSADRPVYLAINSVGISLRRIVRMEITELVDDSKCQAVENILRQIFVCATLHIEHLHYTPNTTAGSIFNCRLNSRPIFNDGSLFPFNISLTLALLKPSISANFDWVMPIS